MTRFEQTRLWQNTLATQLDPDPEALYRRKLRTSLETMRERSTVLAGEIARDLPEFTVHDIAHIDALWEMAQLVAGETYPLTPTEAFVLGGAFLIHDLGMGLAAYPEGLASVRAHPLWRDTVSAAMRTRLGTTPSAEELESAGADIHREATATVLRQIHAERAEKLALTAWIDDRGQHYHLIEDPELRATYARVIGLVAHSHWWSADELEQRLPKELGAPGGFANTWTVNPLKLACILRTSDIIHLDDRRAPSFLRALRRPAGIALEHWTFQGKLYQPRIESDRLVFSSKSGFSSDEAAAWWLCYDTLREVDLELEQVDSLLADLRLPRLAAKGLAYIDKPGRLAKLIPTEGWYPVDAQIRVGAVASLVAKLGGSELYGNRSDVPLRELIQNGADAVRARRALESLSPDWGKIRVQIVNVNDEQWVEVSDNGVGMSSTVLTGPFLDFGASFWGSHMMHIEFPGLESTQFQSTGRFGIGFFSVFMWGDRVQVITRRYEKGREDTKVLDFQKGLGARPMLRAAHLDEFLKDGGTTVRVRLRKNFTGKDLLQPPGRQNPLTLQELCARLCATLDVTVEVRGEDAEGWSIALEANDWMKMEGERLLHRINIGDDPDRIGTKEQVCRRFGRLLEPVYNEEGVLIGRATVTARVWDSEAFEPRGLVTVGGFASSQLSGITGVLLGEAQGAARNSGKPFLDGEALRQFATSQLSSLKKLYKNEKAQHRLAVTVRVLGGMPSNLPVARSAGGWLTPSELRVWAKTHHEILVTEPFVVDFAEQLNSEFCLDANVLACESGYSSILHYSDADWPRPFENSVAPSLFGLAIECIAQAWEVPIADVYTRQARQYRKKRIGASGENPISDDAIVLVRKHR